MSTIETGKRRRDDVAGEDSDSDIVLLSGPPSSASCQPTKRRRTLSAKAVALQGENGAKRAATSTRTTPVKTRPVVPVVTPCAKVSVSKSVSSNPKASEKILNPGVLEIVVDGHTLRTTPVFDMFWRYAASRQELENRRRAGEEAP